MYDKEIYYEGFTFSSPLKISDSDDPVPENFFTKEVNLPGKVIVVQIL